MAEFVDEHIAFVILGVYLYISLGSFSLLYYISKYKIDIATTKVFIESLSPPLRKVYGFGGIGFNMVGYKSQHPTLQSPTGPTFQYLATSVILFFFSFLLSVMYVIPLVRTKTLTGIDGLNYLIGLVVSIYLLTRAWFFGHKLKDMQAAASNEETDTS